MAGRAITGSAVLIGVAVGITIVATMVIAYFTVLQRPEPPSAAEVDRALTDHTTALVAPLCNLAHAMAEYSTMNDVDRFAAAVQAIQADSNKIVLAAANTIADVRRQVEQKHDPASYATIRRVELLAEAAHEVDATVSSAINWSEEWRKEKPVHTFLVDWPSAAIQGETLILLLDGDRGQGNCAQTFLSDEATLKLGRDRRSAEAHLHAMLEGYHAKAAARAAQLARDPDVPEADRKAAAEDLKLRQQAFRTDFARLTHRATTRLFGVVTD